MCVEFSVESASQEVGGADPEGAAGLRELSQGMAISLAYSLDLWWKHFLGAHRGR